MATQWMNGDKLDAGKVFKDGLTSAISAAIMWGVTRAVAGIRDASTEAMEALKEADLEYDKQQLVDNTTEMLDEVKQSLTKRERGRVLSGVYDRSTGEYFYYVNDLKGDPPSDLVASLKSRLDNMPDDILNGYDRTKGAGSHAEIYAVNAALNANPNASLSDILVYSISVNGSRAGTAVPCCDHCRYILGEFLDALSIISG